MTLRIERLDSCVTEERPMQVVNVLLAAMLGCLYQKLTRGQAAERIPQHPPN